MFSCIWSCYSFVIGNLYHRCWFDCIRNNCIGWFNTSARSILCILLHSNLLQFHITFLICFVYQTVERFFSKEIKYLVSSKPEARYAQRLLPDSPAPSPDSGVSSPHPSSKRDSHIHRGSSQGPTDTVSDDTFALLVFTCTCNFVSVYFSLKF